MIRIWVWKLMGVIELIKIVYPLKSSPEFNRTQVKWKMAYSSTLYLYVLVYLRVLCALNKKKHYCCFLLKWVNLPPQRYLMCKMYIKCFWFRGGQRNSVVVKFNLFGKLYLRKCVKWTFSFYINRYISRT